MPEAFSGTRYRLAARISVRVGGQCFLHRQADDAARLEPSPADGAPRTRVPEPQPNAESEETDGAPTRWRSGEDSNDGVRPRDAGRRQPRHRSSGALRIEAAPMESAGDDGAAAVLHQDRWRCVGGSSHAGPRYPALLDAHAPEVLDARRSTPKIVPAVRRLGDALKEFHKETYAEAYLETQTHPPPSS